MSIVEASAFPSLAPARAHTPNDHKAFINYNLTYACECRPRPSALPSIVKLVSSAFVSEIIEGVKRAQLQQQQQHANAAAASSLPIIGSKIASAASSSTTAVKSPSGGAGMEPDELKMPNLND